MNGLIASVAVLSFGTYIIVILYKMYQFHKQDKEEKEKEKVRIVAFKECLKEMEKISNGQQIFRQTASNGSASAA